MNESGSRGGRGMSDRGLEILKRRAESLAQIDIEENAVETAGLLLFRLGEEWYAVHIGGVREIFNDFAVTPIPRLPEHVLGVINIRGEIISVIDIAALMHASTDGEHTGADEPNGIVVRTDACVSTLVVDEIGDIIEVPRSSFEPPLSTLDKSQAEFVSASVYTDDLLVGVINLDKILEPIGDTV
ncbi:MAG: chemotaxis protein CheW [Coriobacteriia bacterium]